MVLNCIKKKPLQATLDAITVHSQRHTQDNFPSAETILTGNACLSCHSVQAKAWGHKFKANLSNIASLPQEEERKTETRQTYYDFASPQQCTPHRVIPLELSSSTKVNALEFILDSLKNKEELILTVDLALLPQEGELGQRTNAGLTLTSWRLRD